MKYKLVLQAEVLREIQDAFEWYEEQKDGLGDELIEEIETCYSKLIENPQRYSFINHIYRRIKTNRFPYLIIYQIEQDDIIIVGVRHVKRNPKYL